MTRGSLPRSPDKHRELSTLSWSSFTVLPFKWNYPKDPLEIHWSDSFSTPQVPCTVCPLEKNVLQDALLAIKWIGSECF